MDEFYRTIEEGNLCGALTVFLDSLGKEIIPDVFTGGSDLKHLDVFLNRVLPVAVVDCAPLFLAHTEYIGRAIAVAEQALQNNYLPARMVHCLIYLRCLEALAAVAKGDLHAAHRHILKAAGKEDENGGQFKEHLSGKLAAAMGQEKQYSAVTVSSSSLRRFVDAYLDELGKQGATAVLLVVRDPVHVLLEALQREEHRSGVVRGLFVDTQTKEATVKNIIAVIEEGEEEIVYFSAAEETISATMRAAADNARKATHNYLLQHGYPEGLTGRTIRWQIADPSSRAEPPETVFDGSSIGLPLVVAIISAYVEQPVPSDIAFTGAIDMATAERAVLLPVGGINEKLNSAARYHFGQVWYPTLNNPEIEPATRKYAEQHDTELHPVSVATSPCDYILRPPPEENMFGHFLKELLGLPGSIKTYCRMPYTHHLASALLIASIYFFEGLQLHFTFSPVGFPFSLALLFSSGIALAVALSILTSYLLPAIGVRFEKRYAWHLSILLLSIPNVLAFFLFCFMTSGQHADISSLVDWPVPVVILKDLIIIWAFVVTYLSNMHAYVFAMNELARRRQFATLSKCVSGKPQQNLPLAVLQVPLSWYLIFTAIALGVLLFGELYGFTCLREEVPGSSYYVGFAIVRDILFIIVTIETLAWFYTRLVWLQGIAERHTSRPE